MSRKNANSVSELALTPSRTVECSSWMQHEGGRDTIVEAARTLERLIWRLSQTLILALVEGNVLQLKYFQPSCTDELTCWWKGDDGKAESGSETRWKRNMKFVYQIP